MSNALQKYNEEDTPKLRKGRQEPRRELYKKFSPLRRKKEPSNPLKEFFNKLFGKRAIPIPVNTGIQGIAGLNPEEVTELFKKAVKQAIETKKQKGLPIAGYDIQSNRAYLENADGSREYV